MNRRGTIVALLLAIGAGCLFQDAAQAQQRQRRGIRGIVERGRYLVEFGGCNDCHTPKVFTDRGPVFDTTRTLSGHPSGEKIPEVPVNILGPGKWGAVTNGHLSAWAGPWGISYTANLTPDETSGLGKWTEAMFIRAMRTGKHMGEGRQILPPMPWESLKGLRESDLKAIFAYLRSLKPIQNVVPEPVPPAGGGAPGQ